MVESGAVALERTPLRLRHSLAARITALVALVLVATGLSSLAILGQVRALQASFDLLTVVYVEFNARRTSAHIQAARIYARVEHSRSRSGEPLAMAPSDEANFAEALAIRTRLVQNARAVVDDALAHPGRLGGDARLADLRALHDAISRLEVAVAADEDRGPAEVVQDIRAQNEINRLFLALDDQVARAIRDLSDQVRRAERETERLTATLTAIAFLLALAASAGVVLTLRPLRKLAARVRSLGRGDWDQRIDLGPGGRGHDEVSQLAGEFNLMIEALQERERRLIRGERLAAVGRLAAQVTHEIRNPLSSVALNVELLGDELDEATPEARRLLARITGEVDRLAAITEEYLGIARRQKPDLQPLDLAAELAALLDFMEEELDQAGVAVTRDLPGPALVQGDPAQLRQAFMNLLRNAKEALGELGGARPPALTVRLRAEGGRVRVAVVDNGPGVPGGERERIFEAFYTRKAQGTGLGLAIVQQIVLDHDGTIHVAATGPEGTTFEVDLPACAPSGGPVSSPGPA